MYKEEIEAQIEKLTRRLKEYEKERKNALSRQKDMEEASKEMDKIARSIESKMDEVMANIEKKLSRVNPSSRFPDIYRENARKQLMNSNTDNAIAETKAGAQRAKKKIIELDDKISECDTKIAETKAEIDALKDQLSRAVM